MYNAPIEEIKFALMEEAGFGRLIASGHYEDLNEELLHAILEEAGKFASQLVAPLNVVGDHNPPQLTETGVKMPQEFIDAYRQYCEAGWSALTGEPEYGGQGLPLALSNAVFEMMNSNMSLQLCQVLSNGGAEALSAHGSDAQKQQYLPKLISGEWAATMNLTEPQAGSDVGAIRAKAMPQDDGSYKISGTKIYITYGDHDMTENIIHLVLARTPDAPAGTKGISLFLVPKFLLDENGNPSAANDVKAIGLEEKLGIHASPTCVMAYGEDTGGATGWLLGPEHKGMACMFTMMNNARLHVGLQGVGLSELATQKAFAYARERKQGRHVSGEGEDSVAIIEHPDVRRQLLTMRALTDAARAICYENAVCADLATHGDRDAKAKNDLLTPLSKAFSTDIANEVAGIGANVHGGMGFMEETGAAQFIRDARILTIYEGTNGIQAADLVGRKLPLNNGDTVQHFIAEMRETVDQCQHHNDKRLSEIAGYLDKALNDLQAASLFLTEQLKDQNTAEAMAAASPYLRLFSLCAGGHYLARGAMAAGGVSENFHSRKANTAHFFASNILSAHAGLLAAVKTGYDCFDDMGIDAFNV